MNQSRNLPENYERFKEAANEEDFFTRPFEGRENFIWLRREITGNYNELARQLYIAKTWAEQRMDCRDAIYRKLETMATYQDEVGLAAQQVRADYHQFEVRQLTPDLRIAGPGFYPYSIYQPHQDIGNEDDELGTVSSVYTEKVTGIAKNEQADFSYANGIDRVYTLKPGAEKFSAGIGDFFRMAAHFNKNKADGLVHWAHVVREHDPLRMMLMGRR